MKKIGFIIAFILLTTISGLAQDKNSFSLKKFVINDIKIVITPEKVLVTKLGKKIWEDSTFIYYRPEQSEIIARKFLIVRRCGTVCFGIIFDIKTGTLMEYIPGKKILRYQNTLYFDNSYGGLDDQRRGRTDWGNISLLKLDIDSMKFEKLNVNFPENLVIDCIDPELSNSLQYFSFKARKNMIWYYEYESERCKVSLYFAEKDLIAKVNIAKKK